MTDTLALEKLYNDCVTQFASDAHGEAGAPIYVFDGTSVPTNDPASLPTAAFDIRVIVILGGTIGVDGVTYEYSLDGGVTWSVVQHLGTAHLIAVPTTGVTINFSAGTLADGDAVQVVTTAPVTPVPQVFGWRERAHRDGTDARIVWVPGDDDNDDIGKMKPARSPGRNPRPLMTFGELVTVYIEGSDTSEPENEFLQYKAARLLADAWLRAVYITAVGTFTIQAAKWVKDNGSLREFGATIRFLLVIDAMVPDAPLETAPVDTKAQGVVQVLDAEDVVTEN